MKKIRLAVAAMIIAAGAFGAYAFSSANDTEAVKEDVQMNLYGNTGNGVYRLIEDPSAGTCESTDAFPCRIESQELHEDGFTYDEKPSDAVESSELQIWVE